MSGGRELALILTGKDQSASPVLEKLGVTATQTGEKFAALGKALAATAAAGATALIGLGAAGLKMAADNEAAAGKMQAALGLTAEDARQLGAVAQEVFRGNFGDSVDDVTATLTTLRQQLGASSDEAIKLAAENALTIKSVFGAPVEETSRTVAVLTKNFAGLSQTDAFDIITAGFQKGGDFSGELLDTLREYAPQFAKLGLSADQAMATLIAGTEAGAFNLDKVGDAAKEFAIRAQDGSKLTAEGFQTIGLDAEKMGKAIAAGGDSAKSAFQATLVALSKMDDPLKRNAAGVALFGTQWEDLGPKVVAAMADGLKGMEGFEGATKRASDAVGNNLPAAFEGMKRVALGALTDAVAPLVPKITAVVQDIAAKLPAIAQVVKGVFESLFNLDNTDALQTGLEKLFGTDSPIVAQVFDMITGITDAIKSGAQLISDAWNTIVQVFQGDWSPDDSINPLVNTLGRLATVVRNVILPNLISLGTIVQKVFSGDMAGALAEIGPIIQRTVATIGPLLLQMGQAFVAWVAPQIPPMLVELGKLAAQLVAWIGEQAPPFVAKLLEWGKAFVGWIGPQIPPLLNEASRLATELLNWAAQQVGPLTQKLLEWGKAFIAWVAPMIPQVLAALGKLAADIVVWIVKQNANFALKLLDWGLTFVKWVVDVAPKLPRELAKIALAITKWVTENGPGIATKAAELGRAFITGIINGLADLAKRVAAEIGSAVQRAIDLVRSRFGGETTTTTTPTRTPGTGQDTFNSRQYIPYTTPTSYTAPITSTGVNGYWPSALFPSFDTGGIVPGPWGRPMLAVVHGGEEFSGVGRRLGGGPVNITIDMSGATITKEADEQRLVTTMANMLAQLFASANSSTRANAPSTLIGA